ncbi:MAG: fatty acid CoA ligase family protein [Desulfobulbaceae bacterium]|nr:fatty acid CoA ligase family protein [Desulfobulbaceae bacterium]
MKYPCTSYRKEGGSTPLLDYTIWDHFRTIASKFPDNDAVVSLPQNIKLTYQQLALKVDQFASGLVALGIKKGDRVGIWSTNNLEWIVLQLATARIGAILVNINPAYRPSELAYALKQSQINCLVTIPSFHTSNYVEMLLKLLPDLSNKHWNLSQHEDFSSLHAVILYDPAKPENSSKPYEGFLTWRDVEQSGVSVTTAHLDDISTKLDPYDPINIQYTSGTTGFPKAVVLTHHNILNNAYFSASAMHFSSTDRLCVPVPFYHCFGMVLSNLLCLSVGATVVIACEHFDPLLVLQAIHGEKCTGIHGVPTMFIAELEHPRFLEFNLSSLRTGIIAGAPCPPALMKRIINELHCSEILIGYGETEASPLTHLTSRDDSFDRRVNTVGKNLEHQEVKIISLENGQTISCGEIGEICFRGYHIMQGYYNDPEATHKAIDNKGWLHSGDLGTMDKDGYVRITGRLKEMIIRGGENIYPREIEDFIFTHPKVAAVAVFGIPDDYYGEEIVAWIQPHTKQHITPNEIKEFCHEKIAHFKIPKHIHLVDQFPMTVTGKIQKFRMKEITMKKK